MLRCNATRHHCSTGGNGSNWPGCLSAPGSYCERSRTTSAGAAMSDLVIIEAAINGATSKSVNPNVPVTEDEIVADALACFETGAAIVHQHITGFNLSGEEAAQVYLGIWRRVLAERPDALWYPTINLGPQAQWYDHIPPPAESRWPGRRIPISPKSSGRTGS